VHFIDDVDLEPAAGRANGDVLPQAPDLINSAVAGGVDLDHVHILPRRDRLTGVADIAGLGCRPRVAVERLGVDPRGARLADSAGAGEQVGVTDPAALDRPGQAAGNMLLTDQVGEELRPVAAGNDQVSGVSHASRSTTNAACRAPMRGPPHKETTAYGCCG
jgi:hypothetical protein